MFLISLFLHSKGVIFTTSQCQVWGNAHCFMFFIFYHSLFWHKLDISCVVNDVLLNKQYKLLLVSLLVCTKLFCTHCMNCFYCWCPTVASSQCTGKNLVPSSKTCNCESIKWELTKPNLVCSWPFLFQLINPIKMSSFLWPSAAWSGVVRFTGFEGLVHIPAGIVRSKRDSVGKKSAGHVSFCLRTTEHALN